MFAEAGVPRNPRSIRRYCERGDLECFTFDTEHGSKYMIDAESAEKYIKQLQQMRDVTRPDTAGAVRHVPVASGHDQPPQSLPSNESAMVEFLKAQVAKKDEHIDALLERDRETNYLIQGLQQMVLRLQAPENVQTSKPNQEPPVVENTQASAETPPHEAVARDGDNAEQDRQGDSV